MGTVPVKYTLAGSHLIPDGYPGESSIVALKPVVGSNQVISLYNPRAVVYNGYCAMVGFSTESKKPSIYLSIIIAQPFWIIRSVHWATLSRR
jgi:hypothetical protein